MNPDQLFRRYQELQQYVGWQEDDARRVHAVAGLLEPTLPPLIEDFYAQIELHPGAAKVITGGAAQIARLKGTLLRWLRDLLNGPYDRDYVVRRWQVGWRHVEIGLDQVYTNVALSRIRRGLLRVVEQSGQLAMHEMLAARTSLNLLLDLDLALIEDAYQAESMSRLQRAERLAIMKEAQERLLQSERLAAIGQMMTGLAHESGNALARSQSCLEMLTWEVEDRPEALELIQGIQKAQDHLRQLYEEVRGYAAPLKLERDVLNVGMVWRQVWEDLRLVRQGRDASLMEETEGVDLNCPIDLFRLAQVFRNILENSLAACRDPVVVTVRCTEVVRDGQAAIRVVVRDNGPGLTPEQRERIFDPFFTTKTKGTGLGMAIAKRIIEAHGGEIAVGDNAPPGAEIVLILPRAAP